jgi:tripartite-type tricarboxylate transporter receptor subunit TctC
LSKVWGQQAVVINQPGAGGAIAARTAASAAPDGYTLGVVAVSAFVAMPGTAENLPVQVPRDFAPVGYLGGAPMFIGAAPWLGVKTLPALIAMAKAKPGELSFGVNGIGRLTHLTGELLQKQAGIKLLMVPYSGGTAQVISDMMGQRVALVFDAYSGIAGAVEAGNVVPLAVGSASRMAGLPNVPTVAETLPGFESVGWQALLAPAGTPAAVVQKLNADLLKAMSDPDIRKRLAALGRDDRPMSPAELQTFIHSEQQKWAPIVAQIAAQTTQNK